jgi:hypothetical protein
VIGFLLGCLELLAILAVVALCVGCVGVIFLLVLGIGEPLWHDESDDEPTDFDDHADEAVALTVTDWDRELLRLNGDDA